MTIINESGLYSLVLSSKLPTAKKFRHWVTGEVLPAVRRHGAYLTGPALAEALARPESLYQLLLSFKQEQDARRAAEASCGLLAARVEEAKPKVLFADAVTTSEQSILVGDLAKLLKQNGVETGAKRLFARLREEGYLIRRRGADYNMPTQKAMELGLFEVKETSVVHADGRVTVSKTPKRGQGDQRRPRRRPRDRLQDPQSDRQRPAVLCQPLPERLTREGTFDAFCGKVALDKGTRCGRVSPLRLTSFGTSPARVGGYNVGI